MSSDWDAARPLEDASLHASSQTLASLSSPAYWRALAAATTAASPGGPLRCDDAAAQAAAAPVRLPAHRLHDLREQVNRAGVAQATPQELCLPHVAALARGVEGVLRAGWPASFVIMYDETWALIEALREVMAASTGNAVNMDVLAWLVDPRRGDAGFSPHRDRQPDDAAATFRGDGSPLYATAWVALTDADPCNSCLYVVPSYADPGYLEGDPEDEDAPDPLARALSTKESYQHIRALPTPAGGAALFTHRIIHWGSRGRPGHPVPRVSLSFGCADDAYEAPYFDGSHLPFPPLRLRLALACAQQLIYHERFLATARQLTLFHDAFKAQAGDFDPGYAKKVRAEFLGALKDHEARKRSGGGGKAGGAPAPAGPNGGGAAAKAEPQHQQQRAAAGRKRGAAAAAAAAAAAEQPAAEAAPAKRGRATRAAKPAAREDSSPATAVKGAAAKSGRKQPSAAAKAKGKGKGKQRRGEGGGEGGGSGGDDEDDEGEGGDGLMRALEEARAAAAARKKAGSSAGGGGDGGGDGSGSDGELVDAALEEMLDAAAGSDGSGFDLQDDYED
ncbi:hypothetical protein Rsub_05732 [Raphidocelis subcapitata]|uniref:Uncharacterized protein n=1 Tax=Raphidocelis subcapitata TaxID=307507 RepID=A0A2V0NZ53_9CHLO|nr:hypothetical protein Rsub_05732 [Raphidocelis subcapitata]|eukprot:GBF92896.1 hypothetical protein Rsub_05732 [Raphidocelis subcapitata]